MPEKQDKAVDQILDLLLDALAERHKTRTGQDPDSDDAAAVQPANTKKAAQKQSKPVTAEPKAEVKTKAESTEKQSAHDSNTPNMAPDLTKAEIDQTTDAEEEIDFWHEPAEPLPTINMNRVFYRLSIALLFLLIVVNIPFNRYGTNLARAMPDERALIVRNGLLFTGPGDEIYILEDNKKRWVSSLDAFELYHFQWEQVHEVDQEFVDQFPDGPNLHVLIRCHHQPHIYLLDAGVKRWIENPTEFERAGYVWEEVRYVDSCRSLRDDYPDGVPIPADAGDPPTW